MLQTGQPVLLFPGGAREALSGRRDYPLFWPLGGDKIDFVRVAARFNATIVPFSAIGMIDSVSNIIEPEDLFRLPFIGEQARNASKGVTAARYDTKDADEVLFPALALPSEPQRNYFLFGKAIPTKNIDPKDKVVCRACGGHPSPAQGRL